MEIDRLVSMAARKKSFPYQVTTPQPKLSTRITSFCIFRLSRSTISPTTSLNSPSSLWPSSWLAGLHECLRDGSALRSVVSCSVSISWRSARFASKSRLSIVIVLLRTGCARRCNRPFAEGKGKIGEVGVNGQWETRRRLKMGSIWHGRWNAEHDCPCDWASRAGSGVGWVDPGMLCCSMLSTSLEYSFEAIK